MSNIANRFGLEAVTKHLHDPFQEREKTFPKRVVNLMDDEPKISERPVEAPVKPKLVEQEAPPPPGRGRPSSTGKPWEAEGISRQAWYKRQKKERSDG